MTTTKTYDFLNRLQSISSAPSAVSFSYLLNANYAPNSLNQYANRDVPGYVGLLGTASADQPVFLLGDNGRQSTTIRHNDYFWGELTVDNGIVPPGYVQPNWLGVTTMSSI